MSRQDDHFDAMLRHLGAAYYESQHGRASAADVSRALDSVEERTGRPARRTRGGGEPACQVPGSIQAAEAASSISGAGTSGSGMS